MLYLLDRLVLKMNASLSARKNPVAWYAVFARQLYQVRVLTFRLFLGLKEFTPGCEGEDNITLRATTMTAFCRICPTHGRSQGGIGRCYKLGSSLFHLKIRATWLVPDQGTKHPYGQSQKTNSVLTASKAHRGRKRWSSYAIPFRT